MKDNFRGSRIVNLRELGGYRGKGGLKIKEGLLYRSGNLNLPTEVLSEILIPLNISIVFDLRSNGEVKAKPYTLSENIQYRHRPVLMSLENKVKGLMGNLPAIEFTNSSEHLHTAQQLLHKTNFMREMYDEMGEHAEIFGDIIKEIIENNGRPILFHCSAGKDRTGILAAMLLLALGVSVEDIKENYLLSNEFRKEEIEKEAQRIAAKVDDPRVVDIVKDMLLVKLEYIDETLKAIDPYPTFESYAQNKLGLSINDIENLRGLYLE